MPLLINKLFQFYGRNQSLCVTVPDPSRAVPLFLLDLKTQVQLISPSFYLHIFGYRSLILRTIYEFVWISVNLKKPRT
jgi:hypothetical protein